MLCSDVETKNRKRERDASSSDEEETVEEKKLRLAKRYLAQIEAEGRHGNHTLTLKSVHGESLRLLCKCLLVI